MRSCSRTACAASAVATLTYVYADSTAVLGPLALMPEPGTSDLCLRHAERTSAPRGWEVIRLPLNGAPPAAEARADDLMALADAVRAIGLRHDELPPPSPAVTAPPSPPSPTDGLENGRRGHLRLVPTAD